MCFGVKCTLNIVYMATYQVYEEGEVASLVPRPLPDFISQAWRKIWRGPGIIATSQAEKGGGTRLVRNVDSICTN